ncbi:hypothetical protein RFI_00185 [Reticulomyxa filosa]|uniref:Importin N-terminal domain-containing protein n=1 Tax=Reticulomyxa filosa TaxID=46433 RepID=X6PGT6_RETFI|nr:hypothetical protein RFI_00185 [Reticulomyxa filosa]|eukprot:ETO36877.1 hypothetical protein RFI_00185 [Reticulomyxa filosa]
MNSFHSASGSWSPTTKQIQEVLELLQLFESSDNKKQLEAYHRLEELQKDDQFAACCARVFMETPQKEEIRQRAGLLMKTCLEQRSSEMPTAILRACQEMILKCVPDPSDCIRRAAAVTIVAMVRKQGLSEWPNLLESLLNLLKQYSDADHIINRLGVIYTFDLLLEDIGEEIVHHKCSEPILRGLFHFVREKDLGIRGKCLSALLSFFRCQSPLLTHKIDTYIKLIVDLIKDPRMDNDVEMILCDTLIITMIQYWNLYNLYVCDIFNFMLKCTESENDPCAMQAIEFWSFYANDSDKDQTVLQNFLPKLCPVLLQRICYTPSLLEFFDPESDDCSKAMDKEEDIKPIHYHGRSDGPKHPKIDQEIDEGDTKWNVRKASMCALESLTKCPDLAQSLLKQVGPLIITYLKSSNYLVSFFFFLIPFLFFVFIEREAGLFTFGALCANGFELVAPQLPKMVPYILQQLNDKYVLVWLPGFNVMMFGDFSAYLLWNITCNQEFFDDQKNGNNNNKQIKKKQTKKQGKQKKENVWDRGSNILNQSRQTEHSLSSFVEPTVNTFAKGLKLYQVIKQYTFFFCARDYILLCPIVNYVISLCFIFFNQTVERGKILVEPKLMDALLPPLLKRWIASQTSMSVFPIIECLTQLVTYMGPVSHFQHTYVQSIFEQALQLGCWVNNEQTKFNNEMKSGQEKLDESTLTDPPNPDYWLSSLDLLAILCEKTQPQFTKLAFGKSADQPKLLDVLHCAIVESHPLVKRNALTLFGNLIVHCTDHIDPYAGKFMPLCIENLNPHNDIVFASANWCVLVALEKYKSKMNIYGKSDDKAIKHLVKSNAAISLARLIETFPNETSKLWDKFGVDWILALTLVPENKEKEMAFQVLLDVISTNPKTVVDHKQLLHAFFCAICSWNNPSQILQKAFGKVCVLYVRFEFGKHEKAEAKKKTQKESNNIT